MIKFSQKQFQHFEDVRMQGSIRSIRAEIARSNPELNDGIAAEGLNKKADQIAMFCSNYLIRQNENMRRITQAHMKLGITVPEAHMAIPLRREGFSEDERVAAYLYGLVRKKKRLVLRQSV